MPIPSISSIRKSQVVKSLGIYTLTNFFSKAVSFLLLFVYTNPAYISPAENGLLSLMSNFLLFIMPFIAMGALHSVSTDFFKLNAKEFKDFFTSSFVMPVILSIVCCGVLFLFRHTLKANYGFPFSFVWIVPLIVFCTFCNEHLINLVRNNNEPNRFLFINLSKTLIEIILSVVLVVFFAWRWQGRVAGMLAAFVFTAVYAWYYFRKKGYLFGKVKSEYIRSELVYAGPVIVLQASLFCLNSADKFFLSHFTTDQNNTVGIYSIGYIFASVVTILSTALLQYIYPKIYSLLAASQVDYKSIRKNFLLYAGLMAAGTLLVVSITPIMYKYFINERYHPALDYVYIICIGNFLWAINYFFYAFFFYSKQKRKILVISVISILVSCGCNYFLIKPLGAMGAALATAFSYGLVLVVTLFINRDQLRRIFPGKSHLPGFS